jgi:hypothetical protein
MVNKKSDVLLHKLLKNWADRYSPPENIKARLLIEAAHTPRNKIDLSLLLFRPQFKAYPSSYSIDWKQTLFTWVNENSFQCGIRARLC